MLRTFERATPYGGRVGLRVDVTALKQAEQRALADRSAAMEASQDGIAITDAQGRFLYMNKAHLALFRHDDDRAVIGQPWTILYAPAEAAWMRANAWPLLACEGRWSREVLDRARDGRPVDRDVSLTLKDDGSILCIACDMRVCRTEAAERDRIRQELHLAQRRKIVGQLASGLAHDVNNLLTAISGSATFIAGDAPPRSAVALGAGRIASASEQAANLVRRLLKLGTHGSEQRRLDLRVPVSEAAALLRTGIKPPAHLHLSLSEDPVEVFADPSDTLKVVLNLCVNARDAMEGRAWSILVGLDAGAEVNLSAPFAVGSVDPSKRYVS